MTLSVQIVTPDALPWTVSGAIADSIRTSRGESFSLGLSGGRTVGPIYAALSEIDLPWGRVDIFQTDERAVDPSDRASNYRTIDKKLVSRLSPGPRSFHRMEAERSDLEAVAEEYAALLPPRFDLVLLGLGEDGHVCSIFPENDAIWETARSVAVTQTVRGEPRLTLTPTYVRGSTNIIIAASGTAKANAVQGALSAEGTEVVCPARLARKGYWIIDQEASSSLRLL